LHVVLMTCGTVAAVALVVATLAWNSGWGRSAGDGGPTPSSLAAEGASNPALATGGAVAGGDPTSTSHVNGSGARIEARAMTEAGLMLVNVVASEEQAEFVRRLIAEQNMILAQLGQREIRTVVLLADDAPAELLEALPSGPGTRISVVRWN
jgi:hypothetical protein